MEENRTLDCTVVGDVFWDVIVKVKEGIRLTHGGTSYCHFAGLFAGGSGNIAVGLSFLGGKAAFIGKAGKDRLGDLYLEDLKKSKVWPCIFVDDALSTGIVTAFIDEQGERSFLISRGANDRLSPRDIEEATELISKSSYIYISGYSLVAVPERDAILRAAELARKLGVKVIFDPAAYNLVMSARGAFDKLLLSSDILCPNLEEAKIIADKEDVDAIVSDLRKKFPLLALKLGGKGCVLADRDNIVRVPGFKVSCVDSTGAGDAFAAALIYGLSRGFKLESTGSFANWVAAGVVKQFGARGFPTKLDQKRFLDKMAK